MSTKRNWSKSCFSAPPGNTSTGDDVGTSVWKQELEMELTGSHVHLKLQEERKYELECVFEPV